MKIFIGFCVVGLITGLIIISGCENHEPIPCKEPMAGGFTIGEHITNYGGVDTVLVTDTVIVFNTVLFKADDDYTSYEWQVGDDPRVFTTKEFALMFTEPVSHIPVRLIARWKPDLRCFANDDGVDTVYRYLTAIAKEDNPIFGEYEGALVSNPTDVYTISILEDYWSSLIYVSNINRDCDATNVNISIAVGYKALSLSQPEGSAYYVAPCKNPKGWIFLDENDEDIVVEYSIGNGDGINIETQRFKEKFIGKRKNN